ncbi:hypothetical protein J6S88_07560 [bacterium]|nr:hypothetical protein [bacterium]
MKLSKCTKITAIILCCAILTGLSCDYAYAKHKSKNKKNKTVVTITGEPVEIDEEFKGEFKYFDPKEEKIKLKAEKKAAKLEKKHRKLEKKKNKLEIKTQESQNKIEKYKKYTEDLKNSFLPANTSNTDEE